MLVTLSFVADLLLLFILCHLLICFRFIQGVLYKCWHRSLSNEVVNIGASDHLRGWLELCLCDSRHLGVRVESVMPHLVLDWISDQISLILAHLFSITAIHETSVSFHADLDYSLLQDLLTLLEEVQVLISGCSFSEIDSKDILLALRRLLPVMTVKPRSQSQQLSELALSD